MKSATVVLGLVVIAAAMIVSGMKTLKEETVRHVVVFEYKEGASEEQIRAVTDAFRSLQDKIPGIVSFEHGVNNSPEGLNHGFTHVYLLTFENAAARDAYLPHLEHDKFGQLLRVSGIFEGAFVVDYVPSK
jgi:hypothetical protein